MLVPLARRQSDAINTPGLPGVSQSAEAVADRTAWLTAD
jgi:hypothetical protein